MLIDLHDDLFKQNNELYIHLFELLKAKQPHTFNKLKNIINENFNSTISSYEYLVTNAQKIPKNINEILESYLKEKNLIFLIIWE